MSSLATGKKISRKQLRKIIHTQMTAIKKQALHIKKQSELREENIDMESKRDLMEMINKMLENWRWYNDSNEWEQTDATMGDVINYEWDGYVTNWNQQIHAIADHYGDIGGVDNCPFNSGKVDYILSFDDNGELLNFRTHQEFEKEKEEMKKAATAKRIAENEERKKKREADKKKRLEERKKTASEPPYNVDVNKEGWEKEFAKVYDAHWKKEREKQKKESSSDDYYSDSEDELVLRQLIFVTKSLNTPKKYYNVTDVMDRRLYDINGKPTGQHIESMIEKDGWTVKHHDEKMKDYYIHKKFKKSFWKKDYGFPTTEYLDKRKALEKAKNKSCPKILSKIEDHLKYKDLNEIGATFRESNSKPGMWVISHSDLDKPIWHWDEKEIKKLLNNYKSSSQGGKRKTRKRRRKRRRKNTKKKRKRKRTKKKHKRRRRKTRK
tara:strand:+ start:1245 stop:2555 length:1311 start_codon:yes stop_codon:yes gene_type:complete